ncbi:MAG TPA: hypothetical protein VJV77_06130 [Casimicrobiaceae bacterium]|nr:hypothetical protein [Casimicrobiaceae bacterium]
MKKCVACQFYDRNDLETQENGVRWGKCRRTGPIVHPLSAKSYLVEGVWPNVRDDDWCGEWVLANRGLDATAIAAMNSLMQPAPASPRLSPAALPAMAAATTARPAIATPSGSTDTPAEPVRSPMSGLMRGSLQSD